MRIAIVGPTHPYKGGVAAHTTQTAHELVAAGHQVRLVSWSRQYPEMFYPGGEQNVPGGGPDLPPFADTERPLRWDRPLSWWRTGRRLQDVDLVVLVLVVPIQVPPLLTLAMSIRRAVGKRVPVIAIVHNVVPHETHPGGRWLVERLLKQVDGVVVHSPEQGELAREHGARKVAVAALPPHLPGGNPVAVPVRDEADAVRVLALGMVRDYKGYDLLLQAAVSAPGVRVTVAGELWGDAGRRVAELIQDPRLAGRVELRAGYVPGAEVPALLAGHDVLALPYRHATASQNVLLGHAHGMPVLATTVGTFGAEVQDGVSGLLVPPGDVDALARALRRLTSAGELDRLRAGVPRLELAERWGAYVSALTGFAGRPENQNEKVTP